MEARRTRWASFLQWGRGLFQHISSDIDSGVDAGADCGGSLYRRDECPWAGISSHTNRRENAQSNSAHANVGCFSHTNSHANDYANAVPYANSQTNSHSDANSHADPDSPTEAFANRHARLALVDVTTISCLGVNWYRRTLAKGRVVGMQNASCMPDRCFALKKGGAHGPALSVRHPWLGTSRGGVSTR